MRRIFTTLLFFVSLSLFSQDEKRLALVIGNANYDRGELKNPVNDARLIASTLDSLNFDVILKENLATKRDMTGAIREFGSKRSEYDVAFVYYAGHGIQVDDENFLLPTKEIFEEEFDVMDYGVSVQNIMRYLRAESNEVNILILDACRDNPFESNWSATRSLKGGGLAKIPPPTGSLIAFSTDSGQTAPDGDGQNSVYTTSLSKNMLLEDTSIDQVFRNVRAEVLDKTDGNQRPVEATQLTGQTFYLKPGTYEKDFVKIEEILISKEGLDKVVELTTKIIAKDPTNYKAYAKRADAYVMQELYDKALEDYNKSLSINNSLIAYLTYYEHPNGTITVCGKLELLKIKNTESSREEFDNLFPDYKKSFPNNPFFYRVLSFLHQNGFAAKGNDWNRSRSVEEMGLVEHRNKLLEIFDEYESISEEEIKFYSNEIYFTQSEYDPIFNFEYILHERKMRSYYQNVYGYQLDKETTELYKKKLVDESQSFLINNMKKFEENSFALTTSVLWLSYYYETERKWEKLIELLESLKSISEDPVPTLQANMQLFFLYPRNLDYENTQKVSNESYDIINSDKLSTFLYNFYVEAVYDNLITASFSLTQDYVETIKLIDELFGLINQKYLAKPLISKVGEDYEVNTESSALANPFDMTNVIKFKYLEYLTNLHLNRYEIAEQNYEESKVLFDFFNIEYDEYKIESSSNEKKPTNYLGNDILNYYNSLHYLNSEHKDILVNFSDKIAIDENDIKEFKLNSIIQFVLANIPEWSDHVIQNQK